MRDVAQRAGVSVSTVSHVINNSRPVSDAYRQRVLQAMTELGYRPNALARSLRRQETSTLGLIVPDSANPFFAEIARAIEDASFAQNYSVFLCNSEGDLDKQRAYTDVLIEHRVAGIFFVAAGVSTELVNDLRRRRVPLVLVDREVPGSAVDCVLTDHAHGGRLAVEHLIELGHRRIGCISGDSELSPSADRLTGYRQALQNHDLPWDPELVQKGDFQFESGYRAAQALLKLADPPTAVFACNDLMAVGCMRAAAERGLTIPQTLSVVGFDDIRLASFTNPPLTTVAQPKVDIGTWATKLLLERIQDLDAPPQIQRLDNQLRIRTTTAPPPSK